jgi:hypothetical protein
MSAAGLAPPEKRFAGGRGEPPAALQPLSASHQARRLSRIARSARAAPSAVGSGACSGPKRRRQEAAASSGLPQSARAACSVRNYESTDRCRISSRCVLSG